MKNCLKSHKLKTRPASLEQGLPQTGLGGMSDSNLFPGAVCLKIDFLHLAMEWFWFRGTRAWRTENQDQEQAALCQIYITIFVIISMTLENFPGASKFNSECIINIFKHLPPLKPQLKPKPQHFPTTFVFLAVNTGFTFPTMLIPQVSNCTDLPITHLGRS